MGNSLGTEGKQRLIMCNEERKRLDGHSQAFLPLFSILSLILKLPTQSAFDFFLNLRGRF